MREYWKQLSVSERYNILAQIYSTALNKISGYKYLPTPKKVCFCDWDNIGPLYQDAIKDGLYQLT